MSEELPTAENENTEVISEEVKVPEFTPPEPLKENTEIEAYVIRQKRKDAKFLIEFGLCDKDDFKWPDNQYLVEDFQTDLQFRTLKQEVPLIYKKINEAQSMLNILSTEAEVIKVKITVEEV